RLVRGSKLRVRPTMNHHRCFAGRRRHATDIALANERADHLDAKIDRHDGGTFVMIEEDVVSIGAQTSMLAEKSPHAVERRFQCGYLAELLWVSAGEQREWRNEVARRFLGQPSCYAEEYGMTDGPKLLLVDDQPRNLDALETILAASGVSFVRAGTADEALLALLNNDFAAIILDIKMPGTTGLELARLIKARKRNEHVPILFLTS